MEIHLGFVELAGMTVTCILSFGAVQWQTNQNKKEIGELRKELKITRHELEKAIEKSDAKRETLEKDILEKLSALLVSVAELKGQLRQAESKKR